MHETNNLFRSRKDAADGEKDLPRLRETVQRCTSREILLAEVQIEGIQIKTGTEMTRRGRLVRQHRACR
jgi:hypothetical protein